MLIEAANMLENHGSGTSGRTARGNFAANQSTPGTPCFRSTPSTSRSSLPTSSSLVSSPSLELRSLLNWTCKSKRHASGSGLSKKPKVRTWTHTWICLGRTSDDTVPDASERAALKLAGLGERRFAVDVGLTSQELMYHLEAQFPKLIDCGGFELMHDE